MKWFWYVARNDELMIDCDGLALVQMALRRLERSNLQFIKTFVNPSVSPDHFHLVIKLAENMPPMERQIWQLYFMDHVYRSVNNLFRVLYSVKSPCLLISHQKWVEPFWRPPDMICGCKEKHSTLGKMKKCKTARMLRGQHVDWSPVK